MISKLINILKKILFFDLNVVGTEIQNKIGQYTGASFIHLEWAEPSLFKEKIKRDLFIRVVMILCAWFLGIGILGMIPFFVKAKNINEVPLFIVVGAALFLFSGAALFILFRSKDSTSGGLNLRDDRLERDSLHYPFFSLYFYKIHEEWYYSDIKQCIVFQDKKINHGFHLLLVHSRNGNEDLIGVPRVANLKKVLELLKSKNVPLQYGNKLPARYTDGYTWKSALILGSAAMPIMLVGLSLFYSNWLTRKPTNDSEHVVAESPYSNIANEIKQRGPSYTRPSTQKTDAITQQSDSGMVVPVQPKNLAPRSKTSRPINSVRSPAPTQISNPMPKEKKNYQVVPASVVKWNGKRPSNSPGKDSELVGGSGGFDKDWIVDKVQRPVIGIRYRLGSWGKEKVIGKIKPVFDRNIEPDHWIPKEILAKEGYALGAMSVSSGEFVNAIGLKFMKINPDGRLNPSDSYNSSWIGEPTTGKPTILNGQGKKIIGFQLKAGAVVDAFGVVFAD